MPGKSLNSKLQKIYGRVASKVGYTFDSYRSLDYITPIQPRNYITSVDLAFALDDKFSKQQGYTFDLFDLYLDTTIYQPGDIFVCDELNKRFTLVGNDPIATPKGILSTNKISIYRPTYNTTGGFSAKRIEIYTNIPAQILSTGSAQSVGNTGGIGSKISTPLEQWDVWTWLPINSIKPRDLIVDDRGNDMQIVSIEPAGTLGYKLHTMTTKQ